MKRGKLLTTNRFKKILLVMPENSSFYIPITESLRELGISYKLFDQRKSNYLGKLIFVFSKFNSNFLIKKQKLLNTRLEKKVSSYDPDLVLVVKGENLLPNTIKAIKRKTVIVNWFSDYFKWFKQMDSWIQAYSYVFTGDNYDVITSRKKGFKNVYLLPTAGSRNVQLLNNRENDIAFIGAYSKKREETFLKLENLKFKIWGNKKWEDSSLKDCYMGKWLKYPEILDVYKNTKIVVNFHNEAMGKNRFLNLRIFEATSCGSLLITDFKKDILKYFLPDREIIIFKNNKDLCNKVKYYLKHSKEREVIAKSGYKRLNKDHTYNLRLTKMFSVISNAENR